MGKLLVRGGKLVVYQGKLVVGDNCDCDPCNKWWCVYTDSSRTNAHCVQAPNPPPLMINGPYPTKVACENACGAPWWCTWIDYTFRCVQSWAQPPGYFSGPYPTEADCVAACGVGVPWWCIEDKPGTLRCVQSINRPVNTVHGPFTSQADCLNGCWYGCGVDEGLCEGTSPGCCIDWIDNCSGTGSLATCDGWQFPSIYNNGIYDPDVANLRVLYETPWGFGGIGMDLYPYNMTPRRWYTGFTIKNSAIAAFKTAEGAQMWIDFDPDSGDQPLNSMVWLFVQAQGRPLPNDPDQRPNRIFYQYPTTVPGGLISATEILPVTPADGDRLESVWQIYQPTIPAGGTTFSARVEMWRINYYRNNALIWQHVPPLHLFRSGTWCRGRMRCGGLAFANNAYQVAGADDIYWLVRP